MSFWLLFMPGASLFSATLILHYSGRLDAPVAYGLAAVGAWCAFADSVLNGTWSGPVLWGTTAVIMTWLWWKNRRNGRWKRAARELGEKSKARIQALVENVKPSPIPSPAGGGR